MVFLVAGRVESGWSGWLSKALLAVFVLAVQVLSLKPVEARNVLPTSDQSRIVTGEAVDGQADRARARSALSADLDRLLSSAPLSESRVGVHVVSLTTGEEIYSRGADSLLNPASNIKLVTAAAALELLGPDYQFKTEIWADRRPDSSGVIDGNIYIKGFGDPSFVTERMVRLALDLWNLGVRRVTGDVVVDETFFSRSREGPGWEQESASRSDRAYMAPVGAVSLNRNAVAIHVRAGAEVGGQAEVIVDPASAYFIIDNRVVTGSRRARLWHRPQSIAEGSRQRILVRGVHPIHFNPRTHWRRVDSPPHYFAHTFGVFMRQQGVQFNRWRIRRASVPTAATLLHTAHSEPLANVIGPLNKFSNNHVAEMLVKVMGAKMRGEPGSWEKGVDVVAELLEHVGIERGSYVFRNGSGLNDVNRVSARQMTTLLAHMWDRFQTSPEFVVSLPVSARDGTMRWRMEEAEGWVRAKTGTLENVSGLSGYVGTPGGEVFAFSVIVNDYPGRLREVLAGIDGIPVRLLGFDEPSPARPRRPVPAGPLETLESLDERAALYLALHAAADPRNIRYLKRAVESETDDVLRALAADALFQSDREAGGPIITDSFRPSPDSLGRLLRLSGTSNDSLLVLSSLSELAAEGNSSAMRLLLEAAPMAAGHDRLEPWFVQALPELGRAAPKTLLSCLIDVGKPLEIDVVEILAKGLRLDAEQASEVHPFREVVREAGKAEADGEASDCPDFTAAAAALAERLERLIDIEDAAPEPEVEEQGEVEAAGDDSGARERGLPEEASASS